MFINPPRNLPRLLAVFAITLTLALPLSMPFAPDSQGQSAAKIYQLAQKSLKGKNYIKAVPLLIEAAKQGHTKAQVTLGSLYAEGKWVSQDYKQAVEWYHKAAEQGNAIAQSVLGLMYQEGKGVLEDYQKAVAWYRKAAEQGDAGAISNLATMYGQGHGVKQDLSTAYALLLLSVKQGDGEAKKIADKFRETLTSEQIAKGQKVAKEWEQLIENNR